ncbi:TonB-dependent receptor [Mucilaginibacter myungsuensis]|uniref:TonB-dependent receptor n=1 Tax=Mucilaginibacter myungsuensis TaxID=649104 RepID=A0A929KY82_9SPHI|nr:TonB-dependent receptor [Mucilaginibacter myungsuensis]MBE9663866.1 TonB-dependent receptor [Mucilaginibacter myungsuensis]MDN3598419.1 TonB-dependent receptor [Mucilaginibacter myungsuensis]
MKILSTTFLILCALRLQAQTALVTGKVTAEGKPVPYASVVIKGASLGGSTDAEGKFQIKNAPEGSRVLLISAIGYQKQEVKVDLKAGTNNISNIVLDGEGSQLNEVTVTGSSRAVELRRNPVSVAVMSKKMMDQNTNTNLIDAVVKGVPGVSAVTTGPNISKPFIRGLGYNRVLTLYDGLRQEGQQWGDEHGIEIDQYGIGRAEVVKGPASLIYGSDAVAGVINLIPAKPEYQDGKMSGDVALDYQGNNGLLGSSLGFSFRKTDWKYSFRATSKQAHNYTNRIDGFVYGTAYKEYNFSASARVDKPWGSSKIAATIYDNRQEIPDGSRDSLSRRFTKQVLDAGDDITNRPIVPNSRLNNYSIAALHQRIQHYRVYSTSEFKVKDGTINLMLGGQQSVRREYNHPTVTSQPGLYVVLNTLNYDLKYNLAPIHGIESTIGSNGMYQHNSSRNGTDFPIPDHQLFDAGAYLFAKRTMGKFDVSGGVRYDNRNISWNDFYVGTNPQTGFGQKVNAGTAGADLQFPAFSNRYTGISGSVGATYNINERLLLKANISRGYRAPNITEVGSNGLDPGAHIVYLGNRNFNPEFNLQQDVGVMAYLKDADISLEVFNNQIDNFIYQSRLTDANGDPVVIVPGNLTYQYQQSAARLYGGELTVNLHPTKMPWLNFNNSVALVIGLNKNQQLLDRYGDQAKYLPFIPPLHARSEIKLTAPKRMIGLNKPFFKVEADMYDAQTRFYALDDTETFAAGYTLINMAVGGTFKNKAGKGLCDLLLQAQNMFDVAYQSNLNRLKYFEYYRASPTGYTGIYNMGRNIGLKAIFYF